MIAFGPVPSRRLGQSLGINHIPPKHCPYSCVYCQVGRTDHLEIHPRSFFSVEEIVRAVAQKIKEVTRQDQEIDFLTFVPDGEPTLDLHLGEEIDALRQFGYPIAVISNAALIDQPDVRQALGKADWVSLKLDSLVETTWKKIDRPHGRSELDAILKGMLTFASAYNGELVTETMLLAGLNDDPDSLHSLAEFLENLKPFKAYLSIPSRPPAEGWVHIPPAEGLVRAYQIIAARIPVVELLSEDEPDTFRSSGKIVEDILSITAVHPMREDAVASMLADAGESWQVVTTLIRDGWLTCVHYRDVNYYLNQSRMIGKDRQ